MVVELGQTGDHFGSKGAARIVDRDVLFKKLNIDKPMMYQAASKKLE